MVTPAEKPDPEPTAAQRAAEALESGARIAIAGSPVGAVRRILLHIVCALMYGVLVYLAGTAGLVCGLVGLTALLLLAFTDRGM